MFEIRCLNMFWYSGIEISCLFTLRYTIPRAIIIPNDPSGSCRGSFQVSIAMIYLTITLKASLTPSPFFAEVLNHFGMKLYSWTILEISKSLGSLGSLGRSDLLQTKSTGIFLPPGIRTFSSISAFHFSKAAWNVRTSV